MFQKGEKLTNRFSSRLFLAGAVLVLVFLGLVWPKVSYADTWTFLANMLATPVYWLAWLVQQLLLIVIYFFVIVAQYNKFIDAEPVKQGWVIVRDLCNMFFVVVLLVIAFGTVLKIETYHYKRLLPKFLLMAILINFSKTIAGLFIDASQIIMLTFVAGFVSITGGNLISALQVQEYVKFGEGSVPSGAQWAATLFGAAVLALIVVTISLIVVVIMTIILVFRIVALWILVILSPLAYLLSIVPAGQKYASQWWQQFTKYLIVGPVMAFFLWLALTTATNVGQQITDLSGKVKPSGDVSNLIGTGIGKWDVLGKYIIGICLLVGSLVAAQQIGVAGGKMAGDWAGRIQRSGVTVGRKITGYQRVADTAKTYMAMRRAARETRIQETTGAVAEKIGKAKETIARPIITVGAGIKRMTWGRLGHEAENLDQLIKKDRDRFDLAKDNIKNKKDFSEGNYDYSHNKIINKWEKYDSGTHNLKGELTENELQVELESGIKAKEKRAKELREGQARVDKWARRGLAVGGGIIGGVTTGGLGIAAGTAMGAGLGAAYGRFGLPAASRAIKEAGKTDLKLAENFSRKRTNEEKEPAKLASDEEVKVVMDDLTKDVFTRTAYAIEAMTRKLINLEQAKTKRDEIRNWFGGTDKFGNWKNRSIGGMVEAVLEKNYPAASRTFEELGSPNLAIQQRAKEQVQERWNDRIYTLKEMDEGSIKVSIEQIIALKNSTFKNQFKESSDKKQNRIAELLEDFIRQNPTHPLVYDAKAKLAHATNVERGFEGDITSRDNFIKKLSKKEIEEIIDEGGGKLDKLVTALGSDVNKLSADIQGLIQKNTPTGQNIAGALNV